MRRHRAPVQELDTESLIKQVVDKIQDAGNAEADRLRDGIRKAIAGLQTVLDSRQPAHDLQGVGRAEPYADRLDVFANPSAHVVTGSPRPATAGKNKTTMMNDLNETRETLR